MRKLLAFSLLLLSACNTSPKDVQSVDLYLQLGITQLEKGYPSQALISFQRAEKIDDSNADVKYQLGTTYNRLKKPGFALGFFKKATQLDPKFTEARNQLVRSLIEAGQYKEARKELNVVMADLTFSKPAQVWTNAGYLNFKEKHYNEAISYLQKAIRLDKNSCLTYTIYGRALYETKNYNAALPAFDAALPLCKRDQNDEAHYFAGLAYYKSGEKNRGIALMNETILLYPDGNYQAMAKSALEMMKFNRL